MSREVYSQRLFGTAEDGVLYLSGTLMKAARIKPGDRLRMQDLSPQMLEKSLERQLIGFSRRQTLAIATQNIEAVSEAVQEALKAVFEGLGEATSKIS